MVAPLVAAALPIVAEFAPRLIEHFAGEKAGRVAEAAADVVGAVTGQDVRTESGLQSARKALRADPALAAKLEIELAQLAAQTEQARLQDVQDARARDIALRQAGDGSIRANIMLALAFAAIIAIAALLVLRPGEVNDAISGFLIGIGGMFARNIGSAFDFEFGSSRGSREKDRTRDLAVVDTLEAIKRR